MKRRGTILVASLLAALVAGAGFAQNAGEKTETTSQRSKRPAPPKIGDVAPVFALSSLDGKKETDLKSFRGKRSVILIFGSYT